MALSYCSPVRNLLLKASREVSMLMKQVTDILLLLLKQPLNLREEECKACQMSDVETVIFAPTQPIGSR